MTTINQTPSYKGQLGGYRHNAGRKKGSKNVISVKSLLAEIDNHSPNQSYEELLIEDFMAARSSGDANLVLKYHSLILSKVMSTLSHVEVDDSADSISAKQQAFAEALANFTR